VAGIIEQQILSLLLLYRLLRCATVSVRDLLACVVAHFNIRVSSFRDCFRRTVMRPRGCCLHCPSVVQIALSSVNLRLWPRGCCLHCPSVVQIALSSVNLRLWPDPPSTTQCIVCFQNLVVVC